MTEKTVHSTYSLQRLSSSQEKRGFLGHFQVTENARSQELPGALPLGHPSGLCPGHPGGLTVPPAPQLVFATTYSHCICSPFLTKVHIMHFRPTQSKILATPLKIHAAINVPPLSSFCGRVQHTLPGDSNWKGGHSIQVKFSVPI